MAEIKTSSGQAGMNGHVAAGDEDRIWSLPPFYEWRLGWLQWNKVGNKENWSIVNWGGY